MLFIDIDAIIHGMERKTKSVCVRERKKIVKSTWREKRGKEKKRGDTGEEEKSGLGGGSNTYISVRCRRREKIGQIWVWNFFTKIHNSTMTSVTAEHMCYYVDK